MSLKLMCQVWNESPYAGELLVLHLALADEAYSLMGDYSGEALTYDLASKCRLASPFELYALLEHMRQNRTLDYEILQQGTRWASVRYHLYAKE